MKNSTRNKINLVFSSFLVIGFIVCTFFFSTLAKQVGGDAGCLIQAGILVLFGLLLFYATRVGEGKQVRRFSLAVLLLLVLPCAYIIAASFLDFLPFHDSLAPVSAIAESGKSTLFQPMILMLACVGLGYGVPYTFLSGYELKTEEGEETEAETAPADDAPFEGGLAEELAQTADEAAEEKAEEAAEDTAEDASDDASEDAPEEASAEDTPAEEAPAPEDKGE